MLPVSVVWLCDGLNITCYICEWSLFAVYFADAFAWRSTLTGAAQMAGDLLAAAALALTTTPQWARMLARYAGSAPSRAGSLLRLPWSLGLFFVAYAATFAMLAQPSFGVSVLGQVLMGSVYVFARQSVHEAYVALSHDSLPLFRALEFVGAMHFNICMATSAVLSVLAYERLGMTAPFYVVAGLAGCWALAVLLYFAIRQRGHLRESFAEAERAALARLRRERGECTSEGVHVEVRASVRAA